MTDSGLRWAALITTTLLTFTITVLIITVAAQQRKFQVADYTDYTKVTLTGPQTTGWAASIKPVPKSRRY
jgi:hypothetical protein